jgi:ribonuclease HIII
MPPLTSFTSPLTAAQAGKLRSRLAELGFEFIEKPYTLYAAQKGKLNLAVYAKGPKVLIQGKETEDFVRFHLEPEILQEAKLGYDEVLHPEKFQPHFGIDESGKGDFFGPLVIAGVYVDPGIARALIDAGVQDSKRITSDGKIRALAHGIKTLPGAVHSVVCIGPERYNALQQKMGNVNNLLGWGHARIIENLLELRPDCPRALSDQFANPRIIQRSLLEKGRGIRLDQRTKAESDPAVAAASILARERFIDWLEASGRRQGCILPRGASAQVKAAARSLVERHGAAILRQLAKTHFRTAREIAPDAFGGALPDGLEGDSALEPDAA